MHANNVLYDLQGAAVRPYKNSLARDLFLHTPLAIRLQPGILLAGVKSVPSQCGIENSARSGRKQRYHSLCVRWSGWFSPHYNFSIEIRFIACPTIRRDVIHRVSKIKNTYELPSISKKMASP
jgi:hypothetical protein